MINDETPLTKLLHDCHDPEVREVLQAYQMLKQFDAGYQFAKRREAQLSQEALDKCLAYLKEKLKP